jgi:hypothetical protein
MKKLNKDSKTLLFENMEKINPDFKITKLGEAQFKPEPYYNTLGEALDAAQQMAESRGFTVDTDDLFNQFGTGGVGYGETKRGNIVLYKEGKEQRRALQIIIYRMDGGNYELTTYIN